MKTTIPILLLIILQSCYSYKTIDLKNTKLKIGHKYKIAEDKKFNKARLISFNDTTVTMLNRKTEKQIAISKIKTIKGRKFSVIKTLAIVPIVIITVPIINYLIDPNIAVYNGNSSQN